MVQRAKGPNKKLQVVSAQSLSLTWCLHDGLRYLSGLHSASITTGHLQALEWKNSFRDLKLDGVLWKVVYSDVKEKLLGRTLLSRVFTVNALVRVSHQGRFPAWLLVFDTYTFALLGQNKGIECFGSLYLCKRWKNIVISKLQLYIFRIVKLSSATENPLSRKNNTWLFITHSKLLL